MRSFVILAAVVVLAVPAAAQKPKPKPAPAKPAAKAGSMDLPSKLPAGAAFCTINGERIPISTYVDRLSLAFGPQIRETLVDEVLIRQEAKRRKISATGAERDAIAKQQFDRWVGNQTYRGNSRALEDDLRKTRGWSLDDFKALLWDQSEIPVLREKIAVSLVKPEDVKETELRQVYNERKDAFTEPDVVRISHIMLKKTQENADEKEADRLERERKNQAARAKAGELLREVQGGKKFEQVARESSEDLATGGRGGAIPIDIPRGANPYGAGFDAAVFSAPVGLINSVVETSIGFHVIRVDSTRKGGLRSFEDVKERIHGTLLADRRERSVTALILKLRETAKIDTGKF